MAMERNGEKVNLRWMTTILTMILVGLIGWIGANVLYADIKQLHSCKLDTIVYYADKTFTENQMAKMQKELKDEMERNRTERRDDINRISEKLDKIIERVK